MVELFPVAFEATITEVFWLGGLLPRRDGMGRPFRYSLVMDFTPLGVDSALGGATAVEADSFVGVENTVGRWGAALATFEEPFEDPTSSVSSRS